jgi:hypothetical protein
MATTEQLLKLSPRGAIVRMINDKNNTFFDGSDAGPLIISPPVAVGEIRTEVEISVRRRLSGSDDLPFAGQLAFRFNRLDVEATLSGSLTGYRPPMPTSTQVLLDELTRRTGIKFDLEDFILEDIIRNNAAPYLLKAKPESLRWVGDLEVTLLDLVDLSTYVPGGVVPGQNTLKCVSPPITTKDYQPYLNASAWRTEREELALNSQVDSINHPLAVFIQRTVPKVGEFLLGNPVPWVYSTANGPYNLRNATLVSKDEVLPGLNVLVPGADRVMRVRLSSTHETKYGPPKDLLIPYGVPDFTQSLFNDKPRLKQSAVVNASNGTPWNKWLNSLPAPSIITSLPIGIDLRISGPDRWTALADVPHPTNLYNAVVQYNGPRRAYDVRPFNELCNRVIVLTLSDLNTAYKGNITFHYRAPIIINEVLPDAVLGSPYVHDLAPSEGVAPYTITKISGNLGLNHVLGADHRITGQTDAVGRYSVVYDVQDSAGTKVRYNLSYRTIIADIAISGNPPEATRGVAYDFTFDISGGVPDYTFNLTVVGAASNEVTLDSPFEPRITGVFGGNAGQRSYVLEVTDSQGTVTTRSFTITVN